jgi:hypothetical protein
MANLDKPVLPKPGSQPLPAELVVFVKGMGRTSLGEPAQPLGMSGNEFVNRRLLPPPFLHHSSVHLMALSGTVILTRYERNPRDPPD